MSCCPLSSRRHVLPTTTTTLGQERALVSTELLHAASPAEPRFSRGVDGAGPLHGSAARGSSRTSPTSSSSSRREATGWRGTLLRRSEHGCAWMRRRTPKPRTIRRRNCSGLRRKKNSKFWLFTLDMEGTDYVSDRGSRAERFKGGRKPFLSREGADGANGCRLCVHSVNVGQRRATSPTREGPGSSRRWRRLATPSGSPTETSPWRS